MACETLQQKTTHKGRVNSKLQDLQRQEGSGECVLNPGKQSQGLTGHNAIKVKGSQKHCFDMFCAAQHAEDTPRRTRHGTHSSSPTK